MYGFLSLSLQGLPQTYVVWEFTHVFFCVCDYVFYTQISDSFGVYSGIWVLVQFFFQMAIQLGEYHLFKSTSFPSDLGCELYRIHLDPLLNFMFCFIELSLHQYHIFNYRGFQYICYYGNSLGGAPLSLFFFSVSQLFLHFIFFY